MLTDWMSLTIEGYASMNPLLFASLAFVVHPMNTIGGLVWRQ